jgi:formylglycine-generating enzyme required for sulfatase activity
MATFEWCEDVWHQDYSGAPADGSAWLLGGVKGSRVQRGGSWDSIPHLLRVARRKRTTAVGRYNNFGFRVARTLNS